MSPLRYVTLRYVTLRYVTLRYVTVWSTPPPRPGPLDVAPVLDSLFSFWNNTHPHPHPHTQHTTHNAQLDPDGCSFHTLYSKKSAEEQSFDSRFASPKWEGGGGEEEDDGEKAAAVRVAASTESPGWGEGRYQPTHSDKGWYMMDVVFWCSNRPLQALVLLSFDRGVSQRESNRGWGGDTTTSSSGR
jgi:hypothetical protein